MEAANSKTLTRPNVTSLRMGLSLFTPSKFRAGILRRALIAFLALQLVTEHRLAAA